MTYKTAIRIIKTWPFDKIYSIAKELNSGHDLDQGTDWCKEDLAEVILDDYSNLENPPNPDDGRDWLDVVAEVERLGSREKP